MSYSLGVHVDVWLFYIRRFCAVGLHPIIAPWLQWKDGAVTMSVPLTELIFTQANRPSSVTMSNKTKKILAEWSHRFELVVFCLFVCKRMRNAKYFTQPLCLAGGNTSTIPYRYHLRLVRNTYADWWVEYSPPESGAWLLKFDWAWYSV